MPVTSWKQLDNYAYFDCDASKECIDAVYQIDLACYEDPDDQVDYERLELVMKAFPEGFRLWWHRVDDIWQLAGYTGWYPMSEEQFTTFKNSPETVKNRRVVPERGSPYLYLFNYSVLPSLKKQPLTKLLLTRYAEDITKQKPKGLACITVSDDGARVAKRFGMEQSGSSGIYMKP